MSGLNVYVGRKRNIASCGKQRPGRRNRGALALGMAGEVDHPPAGCQSNAACIVRKLLPAKSAFFFCRAQFRLSSLKLRLACAGRVTRYIGSI